MVAFRKQTLLSLDDCLYALQETIPHLTRSSLHRCLQRHGISHLPEIAADKPAKQPFKRYPIGYFHIDIAEVRTEEGKLHLFVAVDRTSLSPNCTRARASISPQASSKPRSRRSRTKSTRCSRTRCEQATSASTCWHHSGPSPLTTRD